MHIFAEMTVSDWTTLMGAFFLGATGLMTSYFQYLLKLKSDAISRQAKDAAALAAAAVQAADHAKAVVVEKLNDLSSDGRERMEIGRETLGVTKQVHRLTNGAMREQLWKASIAFRRIADLTTAPADLQAAVEAEAAYQHHLAAEIIPHSPTK
jgi:hypothetical protein